MATAKKTTRKLAADPADQGTKSSSTPRAAKTLSTSRTSPVAPKPRRARKSEPAAPTPEPAAVASSAAASAKTRGASPAAPPARAPSSRAATSVPTESPSIDDHEARLREHAYLLAESNHFAGDPSFYWHVAERELARAGLFDTPSRARSAHAETR